mgnify:CR=1 FL=1
MAVLIRSFAPADLAAVRRLFTEYAATVGVDLAFQAFESELAALPGDYLPPSGGLLVALFRHDVGAWSLRRRQRRASGGRGGISGFQCATWRFDRGAARGDRFGIDGQGDRDRFRSCRLRGRNAQGGGGLRAPAGRCRPR